MPLIHEKIQFLENQLQELEKQKVSLKTELKKTQDELQKHQPISSLPLSLPIANKTFSPEEKIKIFMNLFRGRVDVFPKRWSNTKTGKSGYSLACANEWVRSKCNKPKVKCSQCPNQAFIPTSTEIIRKHLGGEDFAGSKRDYTIGIYPILADDTCWFLVADFDKDKWQQDVSAFTKTCCKNGVPFALERSRSGNGAHVWIFSKILSKQLRPEKWVPHF
jgi:hypothetical protein